MNEEKALILLSGGQDSVTCLFWALKKYGSGNVSAVGFDYGQRHKTELSAAREICGGKNIPFRIISLPELNSLAPNALTRREIEMDGAGYTGKYPNTFVDGRNHIFLSYAAVLAKSDGIKNIVAGVSEADFSGYPDCREVFIKALNAALDLAMDYRFNIITPLMHMTKAQIWELAEKLGCIGIIKTKTVTCYRGIAGNGCGECPACVLRENGYKKYTEEKNERENGK